VNRKDKQVERYLRQQKHTRSREDEQRVQREARAKKASRSNKRRRVRKDWSGEEDTFDYERIRTSDSLELARPQVPAPIARASAISGLVLGISPGRARVLVDGREEVCALAPALASEQRTRLAVGDEVALDVQGDGSLRVVDVAPRRTFLSRPDPANPRLERLVAANVDRAVVVVAAREPDFRVRLIDRYLVALGRGGVEALVCVSKSDLLDPGARAELSESLEPFRELGLRCFFTSAAGADGEGEGVEGLRAELRGHTSVFVGQSGVGKSSLLNAIHPELALRTGEVRDGDGKGRHTTTSSSLHRLGDGTAVVDTPGVRAFGLFGLDPLDLARGFPGFGELAQACRFRDCLHDGEPGCAVREAVEAGEVREERYEAYRRLRVSLGEDG